MRFRLLAFAALLVGVTTAHAVTIFSDNFDASVSGLNVVPTGWTVADGTVDVVGGGFCQGGLCVDLDGSTRDAGVLSRSFALTGGTLYTLSFDLSGNSRGGVEDVTILFGSSSLVLTGLPASAPYETYHLDFTPGADGSFAVSFSNAGGDNVGALLDNVAIDAAVIPEPQTYALLLAGLAAVGALARRRGAGR